jgi:hypothetical protein
MRSGSGTRGPLVSYKVRHTPTLADLGLEQQAEIYRLFGGPVIDAADLAARPRESLHALCEALRIPFDEAMLSWPAGPRPTDGVWAKHWYARVWASTGFTIERDDRTDASPAPLPAHLEDLAARCQPFYAELAARRLAV